MQGDRVDSKPTFHYTLDTPIEDLILSRARIEDSVKGEAYEALVKLASSADEMLTDHPSLVQLNRQPLISSTRYSSRHS